MKAGLACSQTEAGDQECQVVTAAALLGAPTGQTLDNCTKV
jgi:hypothetical protein